MIELFFATSVNVYKVMIALEEMELEYKTTLIDIAKGEQLDPANIAGSPTLKVPVIRDETPTDGGAPQVIFESGAILQYLAEKTGLFLPSSLRERSLTIQWLNWQVAGLGPVSGQAWHFFAFAPRIAPDFDNSYAFGRYHKMMSGLWQIMDDQLGKLPYLAGEYSIADMACYPWIIYYPAQQGMDAYPNIMRWRDEIASRPAVERCYARAARQDTGYEFIKEKNVANYDWDGVRDTMIIV